MCVRHSIQDVKYFCQMHDVYRRGSKASASLPRLVLVVATYVVVLNHMEAHNISPTFLKVSVNYFIKKFEICLRLTATSWQ